MGDVTGVKATLPARNVDALSNEAVGGGNSDSKPSNVEGQTIALKYSTKKTQMDSEGTASASASNVTGAKIGLKG